MLTWTGERTTFVHALSVLVTRHTTQITLGGILTIPAISTLATTALTLICSHSINAGRKVVTSMSAWRAFVDVLARLAIAWKPSLTHTVMRSIGVCTHSLSVAVGVACGTLVNIWGRRKTNALSKTFMSTWDCSLLFIWLTKEKSYSHCAWQ